MKQRGYKGGETMQELMEFFESTVTVQKKDKNNYCAFSPFAMDGVVEGSGSPEDAISELWIKIYDQNSSKVRGKK